MTDLVMRRIKSLAALDLMEKTRGAEIARGSMTPTTAFILGKTEGIKELARELLQLIEDSPSDPEGYHPRTEGAI